MFARWDLKTTAEGTEVTYTNWFAEQTMSVGVSKEPWANLLDFMLSEGTRKPEAVFVDGVFTCFLYAPVDDSAPTHTMSEARA